MRVNLRLDKPITDFDIDVDGVELQASGYYVGRWIPVSERLPEESGEYFVTVKADSRFAFNNEPTVYTDYFQFGSQWDDCGDDVIAWMRLPDAWRDDQMSYKYDKNTQTLSHIDDEGQTTATIKEISKRNFLGGMIGWVCPVCGRGLSPFTSVCPCKNDYKIDITC